MERNQSFKESQFNASANLAQRLYTKYSDTGQIVPNRGKNLKKLKPKPLGKTKLPQISKLK